MKLQLGTSNGGPVCRRRSGFSSTCGRLNVPPARFSCPLAVLACLLVADVSAPRVTQPCHLETKQNKAMQRRHHASKEEPQKEGADGAVCVCGLHESGGRALRGGASPEEIANRRMQATAAQRREQCRGLFHAATAVVIMSVHKKPR